MRPKSSGVTSRSSIWSRKSIRRSSGISAASTISLDIPLLPTRAARARLSRIARVVRMCVLQQVAAVDLGVRDGHHAAIRRDGDLLVRGAHELPGEALVAVLGSA